MAGLPTSLERETQYFSGVARIDHRLIQQSARLAAKTSVLALIFEVNTVIHRDSASFFGISMG